MAKYKRSSTVQDAILKAKRREDLSWMPRGEKIPPGKSFKAKSDYNRQKSRNWRKFLDENREDNDE